MCTHLQNLIYDHVALSIPPCAYVLWCQELCQKHYLRWEGEGGVVGIVGGYQVHRGVLVGPGGEGVGGLIIALGRGGGGVGKVDWGQRLGFPSPICTCSQDLIYNYAISFKPHACKSGLIF